MVRTINVKVNAAHPDFPLLEAAVIVGSPYTAFVRGVPASIGSWHINKIYVQAETPDGATTTVEARVGAEGVYTATLPACNTSGRVRSGFVILADGIDELGEPVTGYILGMADMAVYTRDLKVIPGYNGVAMHYFDNAPTVAKKGDVAPFDGVLKMYDGAQWVAFGAEVDLSDYYTKEETDAAIEAVAAYYITSDAQGNAFATHSALVNASTYYSGGVARTLTRNDYAVVLADETHGGAEWRYIYAIADGATSGQWEAQYPIETNDYTALANKPQVNGHMLTGNQSGADLGLATTADATLTALQWGWSNVPTGVEVGQPVYEDARSEWTIPAVIDGVSTTIFLDDSVPPTATVLDVPITVSGEVVTMVATLTAQDYYVLGSQTDKPLASEAETDALRAEVKTKANDNAVVKTTGDQTISGVKIFANQMMATGGLTVVPPLQVNASDNIDDGLLFILKTNGRWAFTYTTDLTNYKTAYLPLDSDFIAGLDNIAGDFVTSVTYDFNALCVKDGVLYRCTNAAGHTGAWVAADFAPAKVETVLAALRSAVATKADVSALRYALGETITASATLADRTNNRVVPAAANTVDIVLSFPNATAGKARDFLALVTNTAGNTGSISFSVPSGATIYGDGFSGAIASGETWLFSITELNANTFYTRAIKMEVAS